MRKRRFFFFFLICAGYWWKVGSKRRQYFTPLCFAAFVFHSIMMFIISFRYTLSFFAAIAEDDYAERRQIFADDAGQQARGMSAPLLLLDADT